MLQVRRQRQREVRLQARAAQVAFAYGLQFTSREVYNLVREHGPGVFKWLADQARKYGAKSRVERFAMPGGQMEIDTPARLGKRGNRDEAKVNDQYPNKGLMKGSDITIGQYADYTRDYLKFGSKTKKRMTGSLTRYGTYIFKNLTDYSAHKVLSHGLTVDSSVANVTQLPMYAINLSAIAWQGRSTTNSQVPQYYTMPMYRLKKTSNLDAATTNYEWTAIGGQNPDGTANTIGYWHRKNTNALADATGKYQHLWSNIKLLFHQSTHCDCKVHTDIVQFRNDCGPLRQYVSTGGAVSVFDEEPDVRTINSNDVFWESFWAHRVVHPLAEYQNPMKETNIKFLAKGSITMYPPAGYLNGRHMRSIFYNDGRIMSLINEKYLDATTGSVLNEDVRLNPLLGTHAAGAAVTANPGATNQVLAYDIAAPYNKNREKDTWLLIYADRMPDREIFDADHACYFDVSVTNKYAYEGTGHATVTAP